MDATPVRADRQWAVTQEFCIVDFCRDTYFALRHLAQTSREEYLGIAKTFDAWRREHLGSLEIELQVEHLGRYFQWLQESGRCGPVRAAVHRRTLRAILRVAKKRGLVSLKLGALPKIKTPKMLPQAWSQAEFERLLKTAKTMQGRVGRHALGDWFPALLLTTWSTDWRISAVMGLKSMGVSLDGRWAVAFESKTNEQRHAILHHQAVESLGRIFDPCREEVFGDWPHDRGARQWNKLNDLLGECIKIAGVPDIGRFHAIRRTAITMVYGAGGLEAARRFAGHRNANTTLDHYVDPRHVGSIPVAALPWLDF